jgi:hypothetical protein
MPSRIFAQSSILAKVRIAAMLFLGIFPVLGFVGTAWAQGGVPWQVGDVVVCFGSGSCNVLRIHADNSVQLLDTLSDGLSDSTGGVALNNTLHVLATGNGGGGQSKVFVYSIASINPFNPPTGRVLNHTVINTFDGSGGTGSSNAQAVALNSAGHMFVGNAGNGGTPVPSIVELNADGTVANTFLLPGGCIDTGHQLANMDLSADGKSVYLTSLGGTIQKFTFASPNSCTPFANFGPNVTLYGIKDIPAGALANVSPNCNGTTCPTDETILVVASGFTDPDSGESEGTGLDPDAVNICTNTTGQPLVSCALLLDANSNPGLNSPLWQAGTQYSILGAILDPFLHQQTVVTAGTSGADEPAFSKFGEPNPVIDNAVIWTDKGQPPWHADIPFAPAPFPGTYIVDSNFNLQTVTPAGAGTSGHATPSWSVSGTTVDGLQWTDQGHSLWMANTQYFILGTLISDPSTHAQKVIQAGTSALAGAQPVSGWNDSGLQTIEGVTWLESHPTWAGGSLYAMGAIIVDSNNHVQQAQQAGTSASGTTPPNFNEGSTTNDNTVTWVDIGQAVWRPSFSYGLNAIIVDGGGHVQQVTIAGTTGSTMPFFLDDGSSTTGDNTVTWTDRGLLNTSTVFTWQPSTSYAVNAEVVDSANHVELVTVAGTSGPGPAAPSFVDGGNVADNTVTWADLGQAVWRPDFSYGLNAIIVDGNGHVQQVTAAGTTGPTMPSFASSPTTDGTVTWTDQGPLAGGAFTWQANTTYNLNAMIVDGAGDVQLATNTSPGQSGAGPSPPTFVDSGSVIDGLIWADRGQPAWIADHSYSITGTFIVDTHNNLETVSVPGTSGHQTPTWSLMGITIDGLIWADQGQWMPHYQYFTVAQPVGDASGHVHTVLTAGTSSATGTQPASGWKDDGTTTIDNAVTWTESHPVWAPTHTYTVGSSDTLILDSNSNVQLAANNAQWTGTGVSGPSQPSPAGHNPWSTTQGGTTIDGLQWTNQATPATSVVARYPVPSVSTLQSLALDPLVADCTGSSGTACANGIPSGTNRKVGNFWLGDSGSMSFYKLDLAKGTPILFSPGCPPSPAICGIQSIVVYGGEGANQPGLASLVSSGTLSSPLFTASAQFLQNSITSTLSNNISGTPPPTRISLYASSVDKNSCFNDPSVGSLPCQPTGLAAPNNAIVWKIDVPLNGNAGLPTTETLNTSFGPNLVFGVDNSTDVFVDEQFDDTTFVGTDPGTRSISVHSLHEVPVTVPQGTAQCTYSSPLQSGTYKTNRGTLNFIFTCPGLTPTKLRNMHPTLSLVKKNPPQSPKFIPLSGTNNKGPYRFDSSGNIWTFQWNLNGATAGTYEGTTFDTTGVQSFTVTFSLK